jgi:TPR repeat protein
MSNAEDEQTAKRQKRSVEDDLICPITLELPLDPVTAEDGLVYDRVAIERYFKTKAGSGQVASPITKELIGTKLLTAVKHKNTIETLIETEAITGPLVATWKKKVAEKEEIDKLLKKARDGDGMAMYLVGLGYYESQHGLTQDMEKAYFWMKKAHEKGVIAATTTMSMMLRRGDGVAQNLNLGIMYLTNAATRGCAIASVMLGSALATGDFGFDPDESEALYWWKHSLSENCQNTGEMPEEFRSDVLGLIAMLESETGRHGFCGG